MTNLLHEFKYRRAEYLDRFLADLMIRTLRQAPWHDKIEALIPVPSHWVGRLTTEFHPVAVLTAEVSREVEVPRVPMVRRVRFDQHQIGLSIAQRIENVKGAFAVQAGVVARDACVCVIDDVMTSGATLNEVATVLKDSGAATVYNLVLVRAGRQDAALGIA